MTPTPPRLRFRPSRRSGPLRRIASALVCGAAVLVLGCGQSEDPRDDAWNVLVLVPDTIRGDHLSVNGYERPTTPTLDALAAEGANFGRAMTVAPRTWQSFSSILTGLYPPGHGVRYIFDRSIDDRVPHMGALFGGRGYRTAAFDTTSFLSGMTGRRGFETYVEAAPKPRGENADAELLEGVGQWIAVDDGRPFLAFVRLTGAHWPYDQGAPWDESESCDGRDHSFNEGTYGVTRTGADEGLRLRDERAFRRLIWEVPTDEAVRRHVVSHYDAEIRYVDGLIGKLLDGLDGSGLLDRTIVVVTSDHGESFGEHGYLQHGPRVDETVMHVPLVVRLPPAHPSARPGRRIDTVVRTVDILPTLLDAVGAPALAGLDGVSLLPAIRGEPMAALWAYGETGRAFMGVDPERRIAGVAGKHRMIRTDDWKLVYKPGAEADGLRLYDLRVDPGERVDVSAEHPDVVARLRGHLDGILRSDGRTGGDRAPSPDELERLRELGYVQ